MKRILLAMLATSPLLVAAQQAFTIKGKFSAVTKATIFLYYEKQQQHFSDSAKTTDGSFNFTGTVDQAEKAMLVVKLAGQASIDGVEFYLEPGNISIKGPDVKKAVITGGKIQDDLNLLWKQTAHLKFEQEDINRQSLKLSSLKGKYVLLDFWASWCGPCRAENPNVLKAYNKFKDRRFEILAVSLDNNKERWLSAINQDGMPWIHVSDLKGWKNEVAVQYDIRSIPQNLLIGPDGVIIAKNLRGETLEEKLNEIFR
ncbi:MAG: thioredoxin-like domain-containing protein [Pseudobacter sp.]|uniref:thioredoxin-like domain-containing protein n=1 Tax=Pseudobacter sp. TaxID=2045420 RepID=UPI003F7CDE61